MERIAGTEGLEKARRDGRGVICSSGHGAALHTPSCCKLDATTAGGGAEALRLYKNLAEARKANPAVESCGGCDPEGVEIRDALNRSGAFLHAGVIRELAKIGFDTRSELPVSAAPFLSDPVEQACATIESIPPNTNSVRRINKPAFPGAVAASQDGSQRRGRTIDVCASRQKGDNVYTAVIEVKRLDPAYVSWVFLARDEPGRAYSAVAKSGRLDGGSLRLMMIPRSDASHDDIYVLRKNIMAPAGRLGAVVDHGMTITYDPAKGYGHQGTSLHDAVNQVLEGTFGLIVDAVTHQATTGATGVADEIYFPVIVTTANLLVCEHDPSQLEMGRFDVSDICLKKTDTVIYDCPHPARTRFPDQIVAARNAAHASLAARWPVAITTAEGLGGLLGGPRIFQGADGEV